MISCHKAPVRSISSSQKNPIRRSSIVVNAWRFPSFGFGSIGGVSKEDQRSRLKQKLIDRIISLDRGALATDEDKADVDSIAKELEKLNPNPKPLLSNLCSGSWELRYTTSSSILGLSRPPILRPSGKIFQVLDTVNLKARNIEGRPFFNQVSADLLPLSDQKVAVQFKEFRILNLIPIQAPPSAAGELSITYLDEELRISRGDKGNLFVLSMADPEKRP